MDDEQIEAFMNQAVRECLQSTHVVSVHAERDEDFDGDDIVRVTIVVNAPPTSFEASRLAKLVNFLRGKLIENDDYDFPMVSFLSTAEYAAIL